MVEIIIDQQEQRIIYNDEGKKAGVVELQNYSPLNKRAEIAIEIQEEYQRQGLATRGIKEMISYAKNDLHLHNLFATVAEDNHASLTLFRKCGFEESAVLPQWYKSDNRYINAIILTKIL